MVSTCSEQVQLHREIQSNVKKLCSRPCSPGWQTTILTTIFRFSQRPGKVAAWYGHPKSRPVWSGLNLAKTQAFLQQKQQRITA